MCQLGEMINLERDLMVKYREVAGVINQITRQYGIVLETINEYEPFHYTFFREVDLYIPEIDPTEEKSTIFFESDDPDAIPLSRAVVRVIPEMDHMVVQTNDIKVSPILVKEITDEIFDALMQP